MTQPPPGNDFLAVEPHLLARLKDAMAGLSPAVHVLTAADLAGVKETAQRTPAVHLVWGGFKPLESRPDGKQVRLDHTWLVVTAVRNVAGTKAGAAARAEAGPLMARAGAALMGFRPPGVAGPMRMTATQSAYYSAGFMYLPLAFLVETHFQAS